MFLKGEKSMPETQMAKHQRKENKVKKKNLSMWLLLIVVLFWTVNVVAGDIPDIEQLQVSDAGGDISLNLFVYSTPKSSSALSYVYSSQEAGTIGDEYTITASAGFGGTIAPSGNITVSYGSNQDFSITPDNGYKVLSVKVDGMEISNFPESGGTYSFSYVTASHTIDALFSHLNDAFWGIWSDGVWTWDKPSGKWAMIPDTAGAKMIASGKVDSDAYDDLIGVWSTGLWMRQSSDGQWVKLSESLPNWITAGDFNRDGRDDVIGSWDNNGLYYRDSATGKWVRITESASQLTMGNFSGTGNDLIGVWKTGIWVRIGATGAWKRIDGLDEKNRVSFPYCLAVCDILEGTVEELIGGFHNGVWYNIHSENDDSKSSWKLLSSPAERLTSGDIDGDGRKDLIGVYADGVWVRYGATGHWEKITASKPDWIAAGKTILQTQTPILSVTPANREVGSGAGTTSFEVANSGHGWMQWSASVISGADWVKIDSGSTGNNSGSILCQYSGNTGTISRSAVIRVSADGAIGSPKDVTIVQAASPAKKIISGVISTSLGEAIPDVSITFGNDGGTVQTGADGRYSVTVPYGYSGTATPAKWGYSFVPLSRAYTNVTADQIGQNYTGSPLSVTGTQVLGIWSDGVWAWDRATNAWHPIPSTTGVMKIATGRIDADQVDDLIGVWSSGLWVLQSSNGQWLKLSSSLPTWISAGDLSNDGRDDVICSYAGDGVYYRDSATGNWIKLSVAAKQLAVGNIGGTRDDLVGVWNDGLWVRYSAAGNWSKIDSAIPQWLTVGDMTGDKRADIVAIYSSGTWYRNSATGAWAIITTPAEQLATGDIDGDGRDDLVGIWSNSVYVRYGATGQWQQISTSLPTWIATGKVLGTS